ncbi:DUF3179 domain-containing protein [Candidatus Poribacteria bacterium]|nr:DUF3179 domain-containing protein [Candidatus Poribacteria bacterium]
MCDKGSQIVSAFSRIVNGRTLEFELDESSNPRIKDCASDSQWDFEGIAYQGKCERENLTPIPSFKAYWFAWAVFHPDTLVYEK